MTDNDLPVEERFLPPPSLASDERISDFLARLARESQAAPVLVAGYAQYSVKGWSLSGGISDTGKLDRAFDLASITKSLVATLVGNLVADGVFSWETRLQEILPWTKGTWAGGQQISALLSHRSGLVPHLELFRRSWNGEPIFREKLLRTAAQAAADPPTGDVRYSDLGYILVGFAVEHVLKSSLDTLLSERLFQPWEATIGSARSWRRSCPDFFQQVVETEVQVGRGGQLRGIVHDDNAWALGGTGTCGHAGLFGTLGGCLNFGCRLLDAVAGRGPQKFKRSVAPLLERRAGGSMRMGFDGVSGEKTLAGAMAGPETFGHLGFTGTSFWCDPHRNRVTVLLSNRVAPTRHNPRLNPLRPKIHDFLWQC